MRALFADEFRTRPKRSNFRTGEVTVATLVPTRLREIMSELLDRCTAMGEALRRYAESVHGRRDYGRIRRTGGIGRPRCSPFEVARGFTRWIGPCDRPKRKSIAAQLALQSQM